MADAPIKYIEDQNALLPSKQPQPDQNALLTPELQAIIHALQTAQPAAQPQSNVFDPVAYAKQQAAAFTAAQQPELTKNVNLATATEAELQNLAQQVASADSNIANLQNQLASVPQQSKAIEDKYSPGISEAQRLFSGFDGSIASYQSQLNNWFEGARKSLSNEYTNARSLELKGQNPRNIGGSTALLNQLNRLVKMTPEEAASQPEQASSQGAKFLGALNNVRKASQEWSAKLQDITKKKEDEKAALSEQEANGKSQLAQAQQQKTDFKNKIAKGQETLKQAKDAAQEIQNKIATYKPDEKPLNKFATPISGDYAAALKAAQDEAKATVSGPSDVNRSNLSNLLNDRINDLAKTYGKSADDIKKDLDIGQFMPTADKYTNKYQNLLTEFSQRPTGGLARPPGYVKTDQEKAADEKRLYDFLAAKGVKKEDYDAETARIDALPKRATDEKTGTAQDWGKQMTQDEYNTFMGITPTPVVAPHLEQAANLPPASMPAPQPAQQVQTPPAAAPAPEQPAPAPQTIPVGQIGQFNELANRAMQQQARQGFENVYSKVRPQYERTRLTPKPQQIVQPATQPTQPTPQPVQPAPKPVQPAPIQPAAPKTEETAPAPKQPNPYEDMQNMQQNKPKKEAGSTAGMPMQR